MDDKLYTYLRRHCQLIKPDQCRRLVDPSEDDDRFDARAGDQLMLFFQIVNMYTRKLHPFIPDLQAVYRSGDFFYVRAVNGHEMQPLSKVIHNLSNSVLFGILAEFCTALCFIHQCGIHHGLIHETTLFLGEDMKRVSTRNVGYIDNSKIDIFTIRRSRDIIALRLMMNRIAAARRTTDFGNLGALLASGNLIEAINELRMLASRENNHDKLVLAQWHKTIADSVVFTHEIRYIPVPLGSVFIACLREFVSLRMDKLVLPIFVDECAIERGASASVPVINSLFDFFVLNNILAPHPDADGFVPGEFDMDKLQADSTKFAYMLLGYLVAYVFILGIPLQCQLSSILVMCVMQDKLVWPIKLSPRERDILVRGRHQFGYMRAGAARFTSLPFFGQLPTTKLFDFFYSCANHAAVNDMGIEHFCFPQPQMTRQDKCIIMQWLRGLTPLEGIKLTQLLTNCPAVSKTTAKVVFRKNQHHLSISTCDTSIDIPEQWLADVATLRDNMRLQITDTSFNKI
jgi:hypothetical protein